MEGNRSKSCGNKACDNYGERGNNIGGHGWFVTKSGRRRRYRCKTCGQTISANTGTAYFGLRCSRKEFDHVASSRVEGMSISATARITGRSRNTIARWLERAAAAARHFNEQRLRKFEIRELQADELWSFIGGKDKATWLFTILEVWSRLWPQSVIGRRSYRNAETLFNDTIFRGHLVCTTLVTTDGFDYYEHVVRRLLGVACVYGQVIKTRRNNRVCRIERQLKIGSKHRLQEALRDSEDSATLNTSFIERLNLTIRQGSAYLQRRSPCHARCAERLGEHIELLRCHYNFVRRHRGLKFGRNCRTPAMQAGLASRPLSFRDIFTSRSSCVRLVAIIISLPTSHRRHSCAAAPMRLAA